MTNARILCSSILYIVVYVNPKLLIYLLPYLPLASLVAQTVKHLPATRETRVRSLGQEDPLEKEMATHSSILAWKNPMDRGVWQATAHGISRSQT